MEAFSTISISLVFNMANGGAFLAFIAVVAAIGFNFSLHKIEEGKNMKSRRYSSNLDKFVRDCCVVCIVQFVNTLVICILHYYIPQLHSRIAYFAINHCTFTIL